MTFEKSHAFWRRLSEIVPGRVVLRMRELIERHPPVPLEGGGYDFAPLIIAVAAEVDMNAQDLADSLMQSLASDAEERAAATQAAEDILRGD